MPHEPPPTSARQLAAELAGALGVTDLSDVTRIVLRIDGREWPSLRVDRLVRSAEGVRHITQAHRLKP